MQSSKTLATHLKWLTGDRGGEAESLEGIEAADDLAQRYRKVNVWNKTDAEIEHAANAVRKLRRGEELAQPEGEALEAIVLPTERPVIDILHESFGDVEAPFAHFGANAATRARIEAAIPSVGRIGLPDRPTIPFAGTGFVVGKGLLMTNRHVAVIFAQGLGREGLSFQRGQSADIDFKQEIGGGAPQPFAIKRVVMIHPYWDMALLEVGGLDVKPLGFLTEDPRDLVGRDVAVIGYPAFDDRNDPALQMRIFRQVFNVKRLQPGRLRARSRIQSFENLVDATTHDSSTLGGNSGSVVLDVDTGKVVALHFAGRYLEANFAVPMQELAKDRRVHEAGLDFGGAKPESTTRWERQWSQADPKVEAPVKLSAKPTNAPEVASGIQALRLGQVLTWSIPLQVTVRLGDRTAGADIALADVSLADASVPDAAVEKMAEPYHEDDYSDRKGYDEKFLGKRVRLPKVKTPAVVSKLDDGEHVLPYEHFSIVVHKKRRIALYTASNVDGSAAAKRPKAGKQYSRAALSGLGKNDQEKWFTDPRIPELHQLPDVFFTKDRAAFDKGHLVRREDVAFGETYDELRRANGDTYHVTNCSPQVKGFNRSNLGGLWGELENLVASQVKADSDKFTVFAGPMLDDNDPPFAGFDDAGPVTVRIPQRFWKVIVVNTQSGLRTFAFVLDQDLGDVDFRGEEAFRVDAEWRQRMVSILDLEQEIGIIDFPKELQDSDQFGTEEGVRLRADANIETFRR